jgi:L-alanine-DL-glutamate epimerase-like enolase superfamily enzyme
MQTGSPNTNHDDRDDNCDDSRDNDDGERSSVVERVEVTGWRFPLARPWGADVTHHSLILTEVADHDGTVGRGFTWTPQIGASSILAMVTDDVVPAVVGRSAEPEPVWDHLWPHLREAGGGGVTTLAMAAIDIALWDLRGRRLGRSLVDLVGRRHRSLPVYGSGVNFHYSLPELEDQARRWVAAGFEAVKIKVGRVDLDEDCRRVAAVRAIIGPDRRLMVDANQRWHLDAAVEGAAALARFDPAWLEEPLPADDLWAHAALRAETAIPIALGENLATVHQFRQAVELGACDIVQPNVVRVGGITPFLRIAEWAAGAGVAVAPHLLPDISAQLALCLAEPTMVEDVEDASWASLGVLAQPSGVELSAVATADTGPGHGLVLEPDRIRGAEPIRPPMTSRA